VALARAREPYYVPEGTSLNTSCSISSASGAAWRSWWTSTARPGLVTLEDLLEEIVGEFTSDTSSLHKDVHREKGGSFIVNAAASVRHLEPQDGLVAAPPADRAR